VSAALAASWLEITSIFAIFPKHHRDDPRTGGLSPHAPNGMRPGGSRPRVSGGAAGHGPTRSSGSPPGGRGDAGQGARPGERDAAANPAGRLSLIEWRAECGLIDKSGAP
jgi:hypothetical protein